MNNCVVLLVSVLVLGGCAMNTPQGKVSESSSAATNDPADRSVGRVGALGLAGVTWSLVNIQSMDDRDYPAEGKGVYTLSFRADGQVAVRADCNRGSGNWQSQGQSQVQIGPLMTTRAFCPPPSLHDRYLADLKYVRSYVMQGGHLFLATMADGAILEFEPL